MSRPVIAVGFFGIPRSLKWTVGAIEENILQPLATLGDVKVFGHFYNQKAIDNPRTGERLDVDPEDYKLLNFEQIEIEEPGLCLEVHKFTEILKYGDPWNDGGKSLENLIHQLHSLHCLYNLISPINPDVTVLVRPDLRYHDSFIDACRMQLSLPTNWISIPNWQWHRGVNDRFCLCGKEALPIYARRIEKIPDFLSSCNGPMHAEKFLWHCLRTARIRIQPVRLRATRIRANGNSVNEDFNPTAWTKMLRRKLQYLINVYSLSS